MRASAHTLSLVLEEMREEGHYKILLFLQSGKNTDWFKVTRNNYNLIERVRLNGFEQENERILRLKAFQTNSYQQTKSLTNDNRIILFTDGRLHLSFWVRFVYNAINCVTITILHENCLLYSFTLKISQQVKGKANYNRKATIF